MLTELDRLSELSEPPASERTVLIPGIIGIGLTVVAFAIGLITGAPRQGFDPHGADGIRVLLCSVGLLLAGCAVSIRPGWFGGWLCGAAVGFLGYGFGKLRPDGTEWYQAPPRDWYAALPNSWDSVQLFFCVAGAAGLIGAIWTRVPRRVAFTLALFGVFYHFSSILSAVLTPAPTPWLADQYWGRVARRYVQFAYMNNAYQFYSPDPGPACLIWACIEYKTDDPTQRDCEWVYIVDRRKEYIDPLGLSYYRRLSISENIAQAVTAGTGNEGYGEYEKVQRRRELAARDRIPRMNPPNDAAEYRRPNQLAMRQILPSYARHIISAYARPGKEVKSVRLYRVLHRLIAIEQIRAPMSTKGEELPGMSPYDPALLTTYFEGEFDATGKLIDPLDELLYWYIPIWRDPPDKVLPSDLIVGPDFHRSKRFKEYYVDYVSRHAGCDRAKE